MPYYHQAGDVPAKRHTIFRHPDGALYYEELVGAEGFSGLSSLLYHLHRPTRILRTVAIDSPTIQFDADEMLRMRHFTLGKLGSTQGSFVDRQALLANDDVSLFLVQISNNDQVFYRSACADELFFVSRGSGTLYSAFGLLSFSQGDYLIVPRGITYTIDAEIDSHPLLLGLSSTGPLRTPKRYRNQHGQLLEHSPYCERDIRRPEFLPPTDALGEFRIVVKSVRASTEVYVDHHPFDLVGWDGYYYPWALSIHDFEPITGRIHQPPPVHQTFEGDRFVVCSFVPRLFDYHPQAIPAPYHHANVMSDEVIFYASDTFMSRKGIEFASLTLHPQGLTHGPHPGAIEASIGAARTEELAVMVDTFRPLRVCQGLLAVEDPSYGASWL